MMVNILDKDFIMTTSSSDILEILKSRIDNPLYNTSYPISPSDWAAYKADGALTFDSMRPLAFYIHIPFCKRLCTFCEYCRTILPSEDMQIAYLKTMRRDVDGFFSQYPAIQLYGFDIGGGTPTALDNQAFAELLNLYQSIICRVSRTQDYEPSIEGTFETLTPHKIKLIIDAGIHRISLGIQSSSESVLTPLNRQVSNMVTMQRVFEYVREAGIQKINLDLMYGLPGQTLDSIKHDVKAIELLKPEQVTVYELRTNQLKTDYMVNQDLCFNQYSLIYEELTNLGYYGEFGQNTFSLNKDDKGLSSYLRHRMFDGWQYKGFGISAQSMSASGLSYNVGKNDNFWNQISRESFEPSEYYALPPRELFAKFIAISGYSGGFSLESSKHFYGNTFDSDFQSTISTLESEGLIEIKNDRLQMTRTGYRHYGAILSMFYRYK